MTSFGTHSGIALIASIRVLNGCEEARKREQDREDPREAWPDTFKDGRMDDAIPPPRLPALTPRRDRAVDALRCSCLPKALARRNALQQGLHS